MKLNDLLFMGILQVRLNSQNLISYLLVRGVYGIGKTPTGSLAPRAAGEVVPNSCGSRISCWGVPTHWGGGTNRRCGYFSAETHVKMKEMSPIRGVAAPLWICQCQEGNMGWR